MKCESCQANTVVGQRSVKIHPDLPFEQKLPCHTCTKCSWVTLTAESISLLRRHRREILAEHYGQNISHLKGRDYFRRKENLSNSLLGEAPKGIYQCPKSDDLYLFKWPKVKDEGKFTHGFRETLTEVIMTKLAGLVTDAAFCEIWRFKGNALFATKIFTVYPERLVHGVEIFKALYDDSGINDIQKSRNAQRSFYTIEHIEAALSGYLDKDWRPDITQSFYRMILADAWLGNQDRHAENWGLVQYVSPAAQNKKISRFAPLFDTARGLLWNTHLIGLKEYLTDKDKLSAYILRSTPLISLDGKAEVNHFDLAKFVRDRDQILFRQFLVKLNTIDIDEELLRYHKYLTPWRKHVISLILKERRKILNSIQ